LDGVGYAWTHLGNVVLSGPTLPSSATANSTKASFAFQAVGDLSFPAPRVPGLSLTTEYRFFGVHGNETFAVPTGNEIKLRGQYNHSFLLGVRYAFNVSPPTPLALDVVGPAPAAARSYVVSFDWDKATLTDRARQIIREAADNSTKVQYTRSAALGLRRRKWSRMACR
jgi:hypothetical protein